MEKVLKFSAKAHQDQKLVKEALNGKEQAYSELMNRYFRSVLRVVSSRVKNFEEAEDIAMEAMTKAFLHLDKYEPNFAFSTWLKRVCINHTIDFLRKRKLETISIESSYKTEDGEKLFQFESNALTPFEFIAKQEKSYWIRKEVANLKPVYKELIELRYFDELSYDEIADLQQIPLGTVKARLHRAKSILNEQMSKRKFLVQ